jgi:hypothetical protein
MHQDLPDRIEDAHIQGLHMEIDPAVVLVCLVVKSHRSSFCALCAFTLLRAYRHGRSRRRAV